jgi:hypothetical protein
MPTRITTYDQAFRTINMPYNEKAITIIKELEKEGHTERSICYAIWRDRPNLFKHNRDQNFWDYFINRIKVWSWATDDPRWELHYRKKVETEKAAAEQERLREEMNARTFKKPTCHLYNGFIYFIQGENGGPIKIGFAKNIKDRIKTLQTGYPDVLKLLLAFPGNLEIEQEMHKQFKQYKLNGEWFNPLPELIDKIKEFTKYHIEFATPNKENPLRSYMRQMAGTN